MSNGNYSSSLSGAGDIVSNLYEKFILRDLLSFVAPGAILLITYLSFDGWNSARFLGHFLPSWVVSLLFFLFSYLLGFTANVFLELISKLFWFIASSIPKLKKDTKKHSDAERISLHAKFLEKTVTNPAARQQRERYVVLKQMSGNASVAMIISLLIKRVDKIHVWSLVILIILLLVGHCVHVSRQMKWENTIVGCRKEGTPQTEK